MSRPSLYPPILSGARYGAWTVISNTREGTRKKPRVKCRCDCGHEALVIMANLQAGRSKRCRSCTGLNPYTTREERAISRILTDARKRCVNSKNQAFHAYGARGIQFNFPSIREGAAYILNTLGPRPVGLTLDRIDNERGYEPGNVRWATRVQQAENRRVRKKETPSRPKIDPKLEGNIRGALAIPSRPNMRKIAERFKVSYGTVWRISRTHSTA